ncbi:hypothetical protein Q1695_003158 [Nippostrongylus brasiliensis]|nr:hypothetical protein Q1695_003158 [Nippostrongylus brasiliensis]
MTNVILSFAKGEWKQKELLRTNISNSKSSAGEERLVLRHMLDDFGPMDRIRSKKIGVFEALLDKFNYCLE